MSHFGLFTNEPEKLIAFYTEKLGFEEGGTRILSEELMTQIFGVTDECRMTKLILDSVVLEIFSPNNLKLEKRKNDIEGLNHWGLEVSDKESFVKNCEEKEVDIIKIKREDRTIVFLKDPEGNLIEVFQTRK